MSIVKITASVAALFTFCFGLGGLLLSHAIDILNVGELTYTRKGELPITVSPEHGAFSYYYQVAFFGTLAGSLLLLGIAFCLYAVAKFNRRNNPAFNRNDSVIYRTAESIVWSSFVLCGIWVGLRILRPWLIQ